MDLTIEEWRHELAERAAADRVAAAMPLQLPPDRTASEDISLRNYRARAMRRPALGGALHTVSEVAVGKCCCKTLHLICVPLFHNTMSVSSATA